MARRMRAIVALCLVGAANVAAQRPPSVVRVRVVDSSEAAVANADLTILRGLNVVVGSGTSDASGRWSFTVPRSGEDYQVVVRRFGYQRGDHFFRPENDSIHLLI